MSYKIISIPLFDKQAKRLSKKYPSLKTDLRKLIDSLQDDPEQGSPLGNKFFIKSDYK
jgi:mRNA-degrading endonuclease RelE of RelBE toxin-antitoxin system